MRIYFFLFAFSLYAHSELFYCQKMEACLTIQDYAKAEQYFQEACRLYPHSPKLTFLRIKSLCRSKKPEQAFILYQENQKKNPALLEEMGWSIIQKFSGTTDAKLKYAVVSAAFFLQQARSVDMVCSYLEDSHAKVRALAAHLAKHFPDQKIKNQLLKRLEKESVWYVRMEIIRSLGALGVKEAESLLQSVLDHPKYPIEETTAVITALVSLKETPEKKDLLLLATSTHPPRRRLCCRLIQQFSLKQAKDVILALCEDSSSFVRLDAVFCLGLLFGKELTTLEKELLHKLVKDPDVQVSITAAWALSRENPASMIPFWDQWIFHEKQSFQILAASAIAHLGKESDLLLKHYQSKVQNSFVQLQLAFGCMKRKIYLEESKNILKNFLRTQKKFVQMENTHPFFEIIAPSTLTLHPIIAEYPKIVDQKIRLHILSLLAMHQDSSAMSMMQQFLKDSSLEVSGFASFTLVKEGGEEYFHIIENLLQDPDAQVQLNAAFLLAHFRKNPQALTFLRKHYPKASKSQKVDILEVICQTRSSENFSFLWSILPKETPFLQTLAAAALVYSCDQ